MLDIKIISKGFWVLLNAVNNISYVWLKFGEFTYFTKISSSKT